MTRTHHSPPLTFATLDDVVEAVRREGGRLSIPRRLVLEALFGAAAPVSAETIAGQLGLELTSVYRNLEHFEALGVVRHVHLGHGPGLYALRGGGAREYLVCESCDAVTAVEPAELDAVRDAIRERFGFEAGFGHFPILGLCAACRAKGATHDH
jgi:Fur family ferric uptake transcriptional regulator